MLHSTRLWRQSTADDNNNDDVDDDNDDGDDFDKWCQLL